MATIREALTTALQHHRAGRLQRAEALYRRILEARPDHPNALHNLGVLAFQAGRHGAAIEYLGRAIKAKPGVAAFHNAIGEACRAQGRLEEAEAHYRQALTLKPDFAGAHNNLGSALWAQGKSEEAVAHFRQALAHTPAFAEAHNNLGCALGMQGKLEDAVGHFRQAVTLKPAFAEAHNNLGNALKDLGHLEEAVTHYRQALKLKPAYAEAHNNLGAALQEQGRPKEALALYRQAVALKPDYVEAYNNLGNVLREQKNVGRAIACYRKAIALNASFAPAHRSLGVALREQGKVQEARAHFQRALALTPSDGLRIALATLLPVIARSKDHLLEARGGFERQVAELANQNLSLTDPVSEVGMTNFHLAYHGLNDRDLQEKVARLYERACPSLLYTAPHCRPGSPPRKSGKIRVGFISKFLKSHSIGKTTRGVLANLSRDAFSVSAIFIPPVADDAIADFIKQKADKTLVLQGDLQAARERLAAEELDILFYQDIGMDPFTYFLAFARLAPVQCVSFGHPVTTGIRNLDYFISSESFEPVGADDHYSERLIRLKSALIYYYRPEPPVPFKPRSHFGFDESEHLYICPQTLFKFHPDFDDIPAGILQADPLARLVLVDGRVAHWKELLLRRFKRTMPGVTHRVTVVPPQAGRDFINLIAVSDVMLDTMHFCGFNTNMEAFTVGTPVVTLPGEFQRGRHTLGLYKEMGLRDCVADSPKRYIELAVRLGTDKAYRDKIKAKILKKNSCLYENSRVVKEYERVFLQMVKEARAPVPVKKAASKRSR